MNSLQRACRLLERWLVRGWLIVAALSLMAMLLLSLAQILARNFLQLGLGEADTVIRGLVMWVVFAGAAIAVHSHRHIRIDVLNLILPAAWQRTLAAPLQLVASAVCAALAWPAARFWWEEWQATAPADQIATALLIIFPLGFAALGVHFLISAGAATTPPAAPTAIAPPAA
jgi:TRAP-type C4-dicarboxylate transport system permease small subunit